MTAIGEDDIIDLNSISSPPQLRRLKLKARLEKMPNWISKLEYLIYIRLALSNLKDDPLRWLENFPNLLKLSLWDNAYDGEILHFQSRGFPKLKKLELSCLNRVNFFIMDKGALVCLEHFAITKMSHLKKVNEIAWNMTGEMFFLTTGNGTMEVLSYPSLRPLDTLMAHTAGCYCIAIDPIFCCWKCLFPCKSVGHLRNALHAYLHKAGVSFPQLHV
ncbi:hypothetical protein JHK86_009878 [Glycine max]|nr:hypothetical protein JHK86_009878 [Glycine max]